MWCTGDTIGTCLAFPIGALLSFTLECFGAGGAVWGFSEIIGLRNDSNREFWQGMCKQVFYVSVVVFFFRHWRDGSPAIEFRLPFWKAFTVTLHNPWGMLRRQVQFVRKGSAGVALRCMVATESHDFKPLNADVDDDIIN
eukprot:Rmarinus@m.29838